jgi:hypothetical protein
VAATIQGSGQNPGAGPVTSEGAAEEARHGNVLGKPIVAVLIGDDGHGRSDCDGGIFVIAGVGEPVIKEKLNQAVMQALYVVGLKISHRQMTPEGQRVAASCSVTRLAARRISANARETGNSILSREALVMRLVHGGHLSWLETWRCVPFGRIGCHGIR